MNPKIDSKGNKEWRVNGKLHRLDGPAVELTNGDKFWFINDILYTHDQLLEFLLK